jgi:hypothetical protein
VIRFAQAGIDRRDIEEDNGADHFM